MSDKRRRERGARLGLVLVLFFGMLAGSQGILDQQQQHRQEGAAMRGLSQGGVDGACDAACREANQLPGGPERGQGQVRRYLQEEGETPSPVSEGELDEDDTSAPSGSGTTVQGATPQPVSTTDGDDDDDLITESPSPASNPTEASAEQPTQTPSPASNPTEASAEQPTQTPSPASNPTQASPEQPTQTPSPASNPTQASAEQPTQTPSPASNPTEASAEQPTKSPGAVYTLGPTTQPPAGPSAEPSVAPIAGTDTPMSPGTDTPAASSPATETPVSTSTPVATTTPTPVPVSTPIPVATTTSSPVSTPIPVATATETPSAPITETPVAITTQSPVASARGVSEAPTAGTVPAPSSTVSVTAAPQGTPPPYAPSMCADGVTAGVSNDNVCCIEACVTCGGDGCSTIPGTNGASDCCPSTIVEESGGAVCGVAPCVMEGYTPSPVNPAFLGTASPVAYSECSNGLPGYQDVEVCCLLACGQCGGPGCGSIPGTGGSSNCCSSTIREDGIICGEPPCIIGDYTPAPAIVGGGTLAPSADVFCSNGIAGYQDGAICCEANCGQCGGEGCGSIPGTGGQDSCCSSIIEAQGVSCLASGEAPCVIDGYTPAPATADTSDYGSAAPVVPNWCTNGMSGYQDLDVCCLLDCGQCGGAGCGSIAGTPGSDACCSTTIRESGQTCDWNNGTMPPCIIAEWTPSPVNPAFVGTTSPFAPSTCSNGIAGVQNGAACCAENCGQCGGVGCGSLPGTGGSSNCCASTVLENNIICGNGVEAPCVIDGYTPAPAGVPGSAAPYVSSNCSNGVAGYQDANVCCAESCGQCGGVGCGSLPGTGGSSFCCSTSIRSNGTDCAISQAAPCIIADYVPTPSPVTAAPVVPSNCSNGMPGYQDGFICCKEACGLCGGVGCGRVAGTNGSTDCCPSDIEKSGVYCVDVTEAPCILDETESPTAAPTPQKVGDANDFLNTTANAAVTRTPVPVGMLLPLVASTAALLGAWAFGGALFSLSGFGTVRF